MKQIYEIQGVSAEEGKLKHGNHFKGYVALVGVARGSENGIEQRFAGKVLKEGDKTKDEIHGVIRDSKENGKQLLFTRDEYDKYTNYTLYEYKPADPKIASQYMGNCKDITALKSKKEYAEVQTFRPLKKEEVTKQVEDYLK